MNRRNSDRFSMKVEQAPLKGLTMSDATLVWSAMKALEKSKLRNKLSAEEAKWVIEKLYGNSKK